MTTMDLGESPRKWKLAILYTGGTIGSIGTPLRPMSQSEFKKAWGRHAEPIVRASHGDCTVSFLAWGATLDSTDLQPADWCKIAETVLGEYTQHDAFLILHGTDTMAYTASALSFLFTGIGGNEDVDAVLNKPVILTGGQLPMFWQASQSTLATVAKDDDSLGEVSNDPQPDPSPHIDAHGETDSQLLFNTDALQNVCGAIDAAATGIPEVCVFFSHRLLRGNRAVKVSASDFDGFDTPNYPHLGLYEPGFSLRVNHVRPLPAMQEVSLADARVQERLSAQLRLVTANISQTRIVPFAAYPAHYSPDGNSLIAVMLKACLEQGVKGLILESYGSGNFPSGSPQNPLDGAVYVELERANKGGVVVVDCTQVQHGAVAESTYASGSWLVEAGAIGGADMTPIAAFAKLVVLTSLYPGQQKKIERLMRRNLAGEVKDIDRLDSRGEPFLAPGGCITALDGTARLINYRSRGPVLEELDGENKIPRWSLLPGDADAGDLLGRLGLLENGELVFDDSSNVRRYTSQTQRGERAATMLILDGAQMGHAGIRLYLYDYGRRSTLKVIYPPDATVS